MQTHIKFLEHQYNQAYKELDFETAEEFYRIKEILIDLNEQQASVEPEVMEKIAVEYRDGWVIVLRVKGDATISYPKENVGNFINDLNKALRGERLSTLSW